MGDFSLSMDNLLKQVDGNVENVVKKSVFDLTSAIIKDTAVDSGRLRANWQVSFNQSIDNEIDTIDKTGNETIAKVSTKINNNKVPLVYWIQNNLPYAQKIEYGGSPQNNRRGMVRINILRFNQFFKQNTKG
jgi:hypothetical protein